MVTKTFLLKWFYFPSKDYFYILPIKKPLELVGDKKKSKTEKLHQSCLSLSPSNRSEERHHRWPHDNLCTFQNFINYFKSNASLYYFFLISVCVCAWVWAWPSSHTCDLRLPTSRVLATWLQACEPTFPIHFPILILSFPSPITTTTTTT